MSAATRTSLIVSLLLTLSGAVSADVITDWNDLIVAAGEKARETPFERGRTTAIVRLAMFDAVNSVDPRYTPYHVQVPGAAGASLEAAAAAAARLTLVRLYPDQAPHVDDFFQKSLSAVPEGEPRSKGIKVGEEVATQILALRTKDGADAPNTYRPRTSPGAYIPTAAPIGSSWGQVTPFALKQGSQFRPAAPPSLRSAQWAKDCDEVKRLGAKNGSTRTAEQTEIARVWEATGPVFYSPVVQQLASARKLDVIDNARMFALHAMAIADAYIAVFDAKYTYNFWRPLTAIRNADEDGNDATQRDPAWEPFVNTPMHPEYPCAHCITTAAGATALEAFLGKEPFVVTLTSPTAPGVIRRYSRLSDFVQESIDARVYDGVHYRTSGEVGVAMGRQIAAYVLQNYLRPIR